MSDLSQVVASGLRLWGHLEPILASPAFHGAMLFLLWLGIFKRNPTNKRLNAEVANVTAKLNQLHEDIGERLGQLHGEVIAIRSNTAKG
jgi:hypothetical protein